MAVVVTISAPERADPGERFFVSGIVYESTTGVPHSGVPVDIYRDSASLGSATTGVDGDYLDEVRIGRPGTYQLRARSMGVWSPIHTISIGIPPPVEIVVTIDAPSTAVKAETFLVSGTVYEDGTPIVGTRVGCHSNGAAFGSGTTDVNGRYEITGSIPTAGNYTLRANARGKIVSTIITIRERAVVVTISAPRYVLIGANFTVSGNVYDSVTGEPYQDVAVEPFWNGNTMGIRRTNEEGFWFVGFRLMTPITVTMKARSFGVWSPEIIVTSVFELPTVPPPPPPPPPTPSPSLYEVRFACIPVVEGVACTLDGEVRYSDEVGVCSFFNVTSGSHSYSVEKEGMRVVSGQDPWRRPLAESGITVIEVPGVPGAEWPIEQPWLISFTFEEIIPGVPPEEPPEPPKVLPIVAGRIWHVEYWYDGLDAWRNLETDFVPPKVGTEIHFGPRWVNDGNIALTGHVDIELTSPTGVKHTPYAFLNQDLRTDPKGGFGVQFEPLLIDEAGEWGIKVVLKVEGSPNVIADEKEYTFTVEELPPDVLPPDVPPGIPPVLPLLLPPVVTPIIPGIPPAVPGIPPVIPAVPVIPPEFEHIAYRLKMLLWIILDINEEIRPIEIKANTYSILTLDLSTAHLAFQTHYLSGFAITILKCTGTMELRIGDIAMDAMTIDPLIYPQTIVIDMMDFPRLYTRNAAQPGREAIMIIWRRE